MKCEGHRPQYGRHADGSRWAVPCPECGKLTSSAPRPALPVRTNLWPEEAREDLEERAAIMEYEGGLPRWQAEQEAERIVRERWGKK